MAASAARGTLCESNRNTEALVPQLQSLTQSRASIPPFASGKPCSKPDGSPRAPDIPGESLQAAETVRVRSTAPGPSPRPESP